MSALIIVDVQHDFLPEGALGVPDGDQVIKPIVEAAKGMQAVVTSQDWHPENHGSFEVHGGIWPVHCVAETHGSELHPEIAAVAGAGVKKGDGVEDAYSAFDGTGLADMLHEEGITDIVVAGLATDYCVRATVLDGLDLGFDVTVLTDGCRAVNVNPGDGEKAIEEMRTHGATIR